MLNPHACHKVEKREIMNGCQLVRIDYYCLDCKVKCWHDGSDIHHYFDFKNRDRTSLAGFVNFLEWLFKKFNIRIPEQKLYKDYLKKYNKDLKKKSLHR